MRFALVVLLAAGLTACQKGPMTQAYDAYTACLNEKPAEQCQNERAKFEAARGYADAVSNRINAGQPLVLTAPVYPQQPVRQPITCTTSGGITQCY